MIWAGDLGVENLVGNYSFRPAPNIIRRSLRAFSCLQFADGQLSPAAQVAIQCPRNRHARRRRHPLSPRPLSRPPGTGALRLPQYTDGLDRRATRLLHVHRRPAFHAPGDARGPSGIAYFLAAWLGAFSAPLRAMTINWHPPDLAAGIDSTPMPPCTVRSWRRPTLEQPGWAGAAGANCLPAAGPALRAAIVARLWDPGWAHSSSTRRPAPNHTQDAQADPSSAVSPPRANLGRPSASSTPPADAVRGGERRVRQRPVHEQYISPFISSGVMARFSVGATNGGLSLIRRTWGGMLAVGPGTVWERMRARRSAQVGRGLIGTRLERGPGPRPLRICPRHPADRSRIPALVVAPQPGYLRFAQGEGADPPRPDRLAMAPRRPLVQAHRQTPRAAPRAWLSCRCCGARRRSLRRRQGRLVSRASRREAREAPRGVIKFGKVAGQHTFLVR